MGILSIADQSVLEIYCVTYSQWRVLSAMVAGGNVAYMTERGSLTSPEANQVHKYSATLIKLMAELGLTPSSRSRIHAISEDEEDPFVEFLKRRMSGEN
jgi:P27 family predicted phage terminase small subunit